LGGVNAILGQQGRAFLVTLQQRVALRNASGIHREGGRSGKKRKTKDDDDFHGT